MPYEKEAARCTECGNVTTAKVDDNGDQFLMGANECANCGCEDFEILEIEEPGDQSRATDD